MDTYTYNQYVALHKALNGTTTHFMPVVGTKDWHHALLPRDEFERKLARVREIASHDDEWLFANHPRNYIDVAEGEAWESFDLRSELFLIELEKADMIHAAVR